MKPILGSDQLKSTFIKGINGREGSIRALNRIFDAEMAGLVDETHGADKLRNRNRVAIL